MSSVYWSCGRVPSRVGSRHTLRHTHCKDNKRETIRIWAEHIRMAICTQSPGMGGSERSSTRGASHSVSRLPLLRCAHASRLPLRICVEELVRFGEVRQGVRHREQILFKYSRSLGRGLGRHTCTLLQAPSRGVDPQETKSLPPNTLQSKPAFISQARVLVRLKKRFAVFESQ